MRNRLATTVSALLVMLAIIFGTAQSAHAATKTVTITLGDWNCMQNGRYNGSIARVLIDVVPGNSPASGWINGRSRTVNVIYHPSGSRVTIAAVIFCKTNWWGGGCYREFTAGRWVDRYTGANWTH